MAGKMAAIGLALLTSVAPATVQATTIGVCSGQLEALGDCTETVSFDTTSKVLTITLKNTSPAANGGFLTADAFNLGAAGTPDISVLSFAGDSDFPAFVLSPEAPSSGGAIHVAPFGSREFVISATGGAWLGGGNPSGGIPVGESATFALLLSANITEASLFGLDEAIRFRGFKHHGSDKSFTTTDDTRFSTTELAAVPEPATLLLLGTALVWLGTWRSMRLRPAGDS